MLKNAPMAMRLWFKGRLPLFEAGMKNKGVVATLLRAAKQAGGERQ
jgi:hypothetical protein